MAQRMKLSSYKSKSHLRQDIPSETGSLAPPPTPCISPKQRSGSVPDVRLPEIVQKDKLFYTGTYCRNLSHAVSFPGEPIPKHYLSLHHKKSTSDHSLVTGNFKSHQRLYMVGMGPCTSNLLHSVREKLLKL